MSRTDSCEPPLTPPVGTLPAKGKPMTGFPRPVSDVPITPQTPFKTTLRNSFGIIVGVIIATGSVALAYSAVQSRQDSLEAAQAIQRRDIDSLSAQIQAASSETNRQLQTISGTLTGVSRELSELRGEVRSQGRNP